MSHHIDRRRVAVGLLLPTMSATAWTQPPSGPWRIGVLTSRSRPPSLESDFLGAWVPRLRELGYVEGRHYSIEWRFANGDHDRLPALATELVGTKVDVIVASGTPAAQALRKATSTVPIVLAGVADPVGLGLVSSLSRPGGNITGTAILAIDVSIKSLEFLRAVTPQLARVAVLLNPTNPIDPIALRQIEIAAAPTDVQVVPFEASQPSQLDAALAAIGRARVDALVVAPDPFLVNKAQAIVDAVTRLRLPAIYPFRPFVDGGGLMCYGQNITENYRNAANYIDRILRGARPGDLPIEQPTQFELVINKKAAAAIGITLPSTIILRATHLIE